MITLIFHGIIIIIIIISTAIFVFCFFFFLLTYTNFVNGPWTVKFARK
jgi:hypothetical protein